ncbi:acyl-CoA oxidase [Streptomyces sp. LP05-1]|uniref:Acyl-CoA oxidase n=1 Tax=Streptomyces pyxinae TaxID=2970734 RepID=A0ABT2CED9_9ACTN|nr:acyl-CoA dehydrogenase [Streptomyces sp. LP05-1]MCS0635765.1 acyl-CoA oxidase [Streptomyces sp. LP05-1]
MDSALPGTDQLAALTGVLFGAQAERVHRPWRSLFSTAPFAFREGLTHRERAELSYQRLRLLNENIASPGALAVDAPALTALHEWAGVADPGAATIASIHYNLFLGSLLDHDHAERDLSPYYRMERTGTFLCTEQAHGNDAAQLETTATFDRATGGFVLHTPTAGACKFMPNTSSLGGAKDALVAARLLVDGDDKGVFLFLTPLSDGAGRHLPGVGVRPLPQTSGAPVDHCATRFHRVALPYSALLQGEHGRLAPDGRFTSSLGNSRKRFLRSIGRVTMGKLCMSAYSLGGMRQAVSIAVRHAHTRRTSGMTKGARVPLMAHRSHHAPLLDALATTYAATLVHRSAVRRWAGATEADREDCERLTAVVKGWITWRARAVMTECRERCGAQGLALAHGITGQLAANEGTITAEGDNLVIWVKAAGEMLLGGLTPGQVTGTPPAGRSLRDPRHLQDLLADVERIWHQRARNRLRTGRAGSPLKRWNAAVGPGLELVDAHAHRLAGDALLDAAGQVASPEARQRLRDLHALFALRRVAAHSGDLLALGRLTADQVLGLTDVVEEVIADLEPHALELSEAFWVPGDVTVPAGGSGRRAENPALVVPV